MLVGVPHKVETQCRLIHYSTFERVSGVTIPNSLGFTLRLVFGAGLPTTGLARFNS